MFCTEPCLKPRWTLIKLIQNVNWFVHLVQVPRWDAPWLLHQSINLLRLSPRSRIMLPRAINEWVLYPGHGEVLSPVIFGGVCGPHWRGIFSAGSWFFRLILWFGCRDSAMGTWYLVPLVAHLDWPAVIHGVFGTNWFLCEIAH